MEPSVYFVPLVDVTWASFTPLDKNKGYHVGPPPLQLCHEESERAIGFMHRLVGNHFAFALHTGTYCRDEFYNSPFLATWQHAVNLGAEVLVHPHEEIAGKGTLYDDRAHMEQVTQSAMHMLQAAGIEPVGYRGGHYGYASFMTELLEKLGLRLEFSAAPGINNPLWSATWGAAPFSAYYLSREDQNTPGESPVIEVPIGSDGRGGDNRNLLYIDNQGTDLETLKSIWDVINERSKAAGKPQVIHTLYHTISMSSPAMQDRFERFLDFATTHGGTTLKPSQVPAKVAELGLA